MSSFSHALSTNNYGPAKFIVSASAANGTHTTIASAISSASSGDTIFIRPGTYTENLTLKAGVNLSSYTCDGFNGQVVISGKLLFNTAGEVCISGIQVQTNGDFCLENTSTGTITLINCLIIASDNTAISMSAGNIQCFYSHGDIEDTGITLFALTGGALRCTYCTFFNSSSSTTVSTANNAQVLSNFSIFSNAIQTSGTTGTIQGAHSAFVPNFNLTAIDHTSTSANASTLTGCDFNTGNQTSITIGAGASLRLVNSSIRSTAAAAVSGAGTFSSANLSFYNTSVVSVTTQIPLNDGTTYVNNRQPAFLAYRSASITNQTGNGTVVTLPVNTEVFDQLSNYNNATFTFTAPFSGRYRFTGSVQLTNIGAGHTEGYLLLITSNRNYSLAFSNPANGATVAVNPGNLLMQGSCLADMDAGDTALLQCAVSGSTQTVGFAGTGPNTFFCGELVC